MHELDLTLPDFLDRKLNGIKPEPIAPAPVPITPPPAQAVPGATRVKVFLRNKIRGCPLGCGRHTVELVTQRKRKFVRFRIAGRKRCTRVSLEVWERMVCHDAKF
jgi:hypothetical protein